MPLAPLPRQARNARLAPGLHRILVDSVTALLVLRGLPASGKTTRALAWLAEDPEQRVRVCRDDIRGMLAGPGHPGVLAPGQERLVTTIERDVARAALWRGWSVVIDATNLPGRHGDPVEAWRDLAADCGVPLRVEDLDVDVAECVRRDAARAASRGRHVGADVIRRLAERAQ